MSGAAGTAEGGVLTGVDETISCLFNFFRSSLAMSGEASLAGLEGEGDEERRGEFGVEVESAREQLDKGGGADVLGLEAFMSGLAFARVESLHAWTRRVPLRVNIW